MNPSIAPDKALFDFSAPGSTLAWQVVNDDVMGGVSTSSFELTNGMAVFHGEVSLKNNGGFASVRSQPAHHDLTGCDAFIIRVRGDDRRYKFTVRTEAGFDAPLYQLAFVTKSGEWKEHWLPFKELVPTFRGRMLTDVPPLNSANVTSVGFLIADKQAGPFRLEISWIIASRAMP